MVSFFSWMGRKGEMDEEDIEADVKNEKAVKTAEKSIKPGKNSTLLDDKNSKSTDIPSKFADKVTKSSDKSATADKTSGKALKTAEPEPSISPLNNEQPSINQTKILDNQPPTTSTHSKPPLQLPKLPFNPLKKLPLKTAGPLEPVSKSAALIPSPASPVMLKPGMEIYEL